MSVIMLEDQIYNEVASALEYYLDKKELWCWPVGKMVMDNTNNGEDQKTTAWIQNKVTEWRNQNAVSYDQRYNEDNGAIEPMKYSHVMAVSKIQLYKYLQAIEYQIETSYVCQFMKKAMEELAAQIIMELDAYKKARWAF